MSIPGQAVLDFVQSALVEYAPTHFTAGELDYMTFRGLFPPKPIYDWESSGETHPGTGEE